MCCAGVANTIIERVCLQECPPNSEDFREMQCAAFNDRPLMAGNSFKWTTFHGGRCLVACTLLLQAAHFHVPFSTSASNSTNGLVISRCMTSALPSFTYCPAKLPINPSESPAGDLIHTSNEAYSFQARTPVNSAVWPWVTTFTTILAACLMAHPVTRSPGGCVSTGTAW